ncbi:hypothetical protein [Rhizobium sp. Root1220]|uniref:hypothetical protein n=1 Tax=Rhizobium sp. Root1220 TaxID=1736432 RepID=UPI0006FE97AD|nr:hypothetical protein [Rhizobium sp. Root1220]KQV73193.1 hypothetical protein ASC90_07260 [Rhizobium sp. Root1220]
MFRTTSKLLSLVLTGLIALPAAAGDFGGHSFPRHRSGSFIGHHAPFAVGRPFVGRNDGRMRFASGYGRFGDHRFRDRLLKRVYSPYGRYGGNNVVVVVQPSGSNGGGGTYAGSSYAYETSAGTFVTGSGYSYAPQRTAYLAPMAKVIDVATKGSSCSYEAGVCVIRP